MGILQEFGLVGLVLLIIGLIIFGPFLTIWAINVLFGLAIPYTFTTWLAMLILGAAFGKTTVKLSR